MAVDRPLTIWQTLVAASRHKDFEISYPEVLACDEILKNALQQVEPVHKPVSDGRNAKGRNKKHHATKCLAADEQNKGQHHTAYMT